MKIYNNLLLFSFKGWISFFFHKNIYLPIQFMYCIEIITVTILSESIIDGFVRKCVIHIQTII